jgi:hypothetical protein
MRRTRSLVVLAAAASAALVAGPPAGATVADRGSYADEYSVVNDECGYDIGMTGADEGRIQWRAGKRANATAFFVNDNFSFTDTWTNPQTGEFITVSGHAIFHDIKASRVEGDVFEFETVEAGQPFVIHDSDGELVLRFRGSIHHHVLFDTEGDDVHGGIEIEYLGADVHGPHPGFDQGLCELITPLIGS